jgi:hypothetical protein
MILKAFTKRITWAKKLSSWEAVVKCIKLLTVRVTFLAVRELCNQKKLQKELNPDFL